MNSLLQQLPPDDQPPDLNAAAESQLEQLIEFATENFRLNNLPPLREHLLRDGIINEQSPWFPVFQAYLKAKPLASASAAQQSWVKAAFNPRDAFISLNHRFNDFTYCQCHTCQKYRFNLARELQELSCNNL